MLVSVFAYLDIFSCQEQHSSITEGYTIKLNSRENHINVVKRESTKL